MHSLISATLVQHTVSGVCNKEMVTFEIEMPRSLLAELNTHKILLRNAQSSRAVPIKDTIRRLLDGGAFIPSYWGKNQSGMSASEECDNLIFIGSSLQGLNREDAWWEAMCSAIKYAEAYDVAGYHKQIVGRLLEPFCMVKVLLSGTEWDNFFNLRVHPTAEPHFRDLSIKMYRELRGSVSPTVLHPGEWHLPYINYDEIDGRLIYVDNNNQALTLEEARSVSLSCNAQTSYRKHDESLEKADIVIGRLFNGDIVHASPSEHIATPMMHHTHNPNNAIGDWEKGVTHCDRDGMLWSAQLKGFIQYRQLIPNNVCNNFTDDKFFEYTEGMII